MTDKIPKHVNTFLTGVILLFAGSFFLSVLAGLASSAFASEDLSQKAVPRISPQEVKTLLDKGEPVLIVDVRSSEAFNKQHITGAISVPLSEVESSLAALPADTKIVFY